MKNLQEQLKTKIERDAEKEYPKFDSFGNYSRQLYMIKGTVSLIEMVAKLDEALEFYENKQSWGTHQDYGIEYAIIDKSDTLKTGKVGYGQDTLVGGKRAIEARAELKRWLES